MPDQVPDDVKAERLDRLQALLRQQQEAFNRAMVGRTLPVLFERAGRHAGQLIGRSPYLQAVHADAADTRIGHVAEVVIEDVRTNSLAGRLAHAAVPTATTVGITAIAEARA
jgi:tRNA-2-methylthio-N6-dimethylallyladenosine synthase